MSRDERSAAETAAHDFIDTLLAWGLQDVFICPGSTEAPFLDASLDRPELRVWLTTHEVTTVAMADGFARASGTPAVAYLHTNVGLSNGLGALYAAQLGRSPVLLATGLKSAAIQSRRGFTAPANVRDLPRQFVKWEWVSLAGEYVAADTTRALQVATASPSGPVWLGLPEDLMARPASGIEGRPLQPGRRKVAPSAPNEQAIADAIALLAGAKKPLLVAGAEVAREGAADLVVALSERLGAPMAHEDRRAFERSVVPNDHPNFVGLLTANLIRTLDVDAIAFLGARYSHEFEPTSEPLVPAHVRVVQTHTDPDEVGKTYGCDVAVVGGQRATLEALLRSLGDEPAAGALADASFRTVDSAPGDEVTSGDVLRVADVARVLGAAGEFAAVVVDATTSNAALIDALPQSKPNQVLTTSSGALGWGMGAALGVSIRHRPERVLALAGDGSFQFGIQALWVAARYELPVTFVVINNQSYAAVAAALVRYRGTAGDARFPGKDIAGPNIAGIAEGFGVPGTRVTSQADLAAAVQSASTARGPRLIEVLTDPEDLGP